MSPIQLNALTNAALSAALTPDAGMSLQIPPNDEPAGGNVFNLGEVKY